MWSLGAAIIVIGLASGVVAWFLGRSITVVYLGRAKPPVRAPQIAP